MTSALDSLVQFTLLKPTLLTLPWSVLCHVFNFPSNATDTRPAYNKSFSLCDDLCFAVRLGSFRQCIQILSLCILLFVPHSIMV